MARTALHVAAAPLGCATFQVPVRPPNVVANDLRLVLTDVSEDFKVSGGCHNHKGAGQEARHHSATHTIGDGGGNTPHFPTTTPLGSCTASLVSPSLVIPRAPCRNRTQTEARRVPRSMLTTVWNVMGTPARLQFTDGFHDVPLTTDPSVLKGLRLRGDGVQWAASDALAAWAERWQAAPCGTLATTPDAVASLAAAAKALLQAEYGDELRGERIVWEVGNVIERHPAAGGNGYATTVHRDLDNTSVSNLTAEGFKYFFNVWVALTPARGSPLAALHPASVDFDADPAGFRGLEHDRTGLLFRDAHRWLGEWAAARVAGAVAAPCEC